MWVFGDVYYETLSPVKFIIMMHDAWGLKLEAMLVASFINNYSACFSAHLLGELSKVSGSVKYSAEDICHTPPARIIGQMTCHNYPST